MSVHQTFSMENIMQHAVDNYKEVIKTKKDPVIDTWPLMSGPMPITMIEICYLYFVLKLGPQIMAPRKPFNLQGVLIAYNFILVIFNMWLSILPFWQGTMGHILRNSCHPPSQNNPLATAMNVHSWWWFFSKVVELLDTVFFVLRKKQNQVSFLHVYHHVLVSFTSWIYLKYIPGEQGIVMGFLNSTVHVVMYLYYMVAAMGPQYQKYLWWKKYMTWIQMSQFVLMFAYLVTLLFFNCEMPRALTFFFMYTAVTFFYLFWDFYRKAYNSKKRSE